MTDTPNTERKLSAWADKYRGVCTHIHPSVAIAYNESQATVEDLDPPPALSIHPSDSISHALMCAFERDYTHLTVVSSDTRSLLGYLSIPSLKDRLKSHEVKETDSVEKAMLKFNRKRGNVYKVITMDTPLEELEAFFDGGPDGKTRQDFAVVTDYSRRFVLGVATRADLEEFVKRRPA
jgi:CBS domain-containing protein